MFKNFIPLFKLPTLLIPKWLEKKQTSILSAAFIITLANIIASLSGLVRQRTLIGIYFDQEITKLEYESFMVAFQIPDLMFQLIVLGALSASFIPIFTKVKKESEEKAFKVANSVINLTLLFFLLTSIFVGLFATQITEIRTGPQFTPHQIQTSANLTIIMLVAQVVFCLSFFLSGILQTYQYFIIPAIAPILYNIGIIIGTYLFNPTFGIYGAGIGVIIGSILHLLIQIPLIKKINFTYKFKINLKDINVKKIMSLMPARTMTIGISEIKSLGLTFFTTTLGNFSFVILRLALTLMAIPVRIFGVPISQASLPFLSKEYKEDDFSSLKKLLIESLHQIAFLAAPASILLLILRIPVVRIVFGTKNFAWSNTVLTGKVIAIIALSVTAQAMIQLLVRGFYALQDTKTPLKISLITSILYFYFCYFFSFFHANHPNNPISIGIGYIFKIKSQSDIGLIGIAITICLITILELFLFLIYLNKKIPKFFDLPFLINQIKICFSSFLMAIFLYLPLKILDNKQFFDTSRTIELIALTLIISVIGMFVYIYFAKIFRIKELNLIVGIIQNFTKKKSPVIISTQEPIADQNVGDDII